jgi:Tol biopolymer transport system component
MSVMVPPEASDVVLLDLVRGTKTFLTSGGASDFGPVFTPSGKQVVYVSERPIFDLYVRNTDGGTPSTPLVVTKYDKNPGSITPDGKTVLFQHSILPHAQIWTAALDGQGDPSPLIVSDSGDLGPPALSPDGRWLAFEQQDTGQSQIYMVPYPDVKQGRRAVSTSGGDQPMWTRGGAELVYREGKKMLAVSVDPATGDLGEPQLLFEADYMGRSGRRGYAVTPDGERFLMLKRISAGARRVVVVANWFTELRQKVPR